MRVLLLTGSSARYMAPPRLGEEQINAGPDWTDAKDASGRWVSLQTPAGEYSVAALFAKLPLEQWPDLLVCLVDSSRRNLPRNLGAFRGPKVLLLADTHHLQSPLMTMIRYAAAEPFDRIVFLYDRHHAPFFGAAGFKNLFWFPGLTFPHSDAEVRASWAAGARAPRIAFVGQAGKHHPRRTRLLSALTAAGLPLDQRVLGQDAALAHYGASLLGFNSSLNGDLNLRVFEILAAGGMLLTDELAPLSGLAEFGRQGCGFATYASEAELIEKTRHYLAHPEEARVVAEAGRDWFLRTCGEAARRAMFQALAVDGRAPAPFPLEESATRSIVFGSTHELLASAMVYEGVQELHRTQENVTVALGSGAPDNFAQLCASLPRVTVERGTASAAKADLFVTTVVDVTAAANSSATRVWCADAAEAQIPELTEVFARSGFAAASAEIAVFCRDASAPPPPTATEQANEARMLYQRGDYNRALELGRAALQRDPRNVPALTLLADLALLKQGGPLAEKLLRQARTLAPKDAPIVAALAEALVLQKRDGEALKTAQEALRLDPANVRGLRTLARLHELAGRDDEAVAVLEHALLLAPTSADILGRLGAALRRCGRVLDGLAFQCRALGSSREIPVVDPAARPVRVAFLAQHPQGWTSLESVWRAMANDPAFETLVLAAPYQHPYPPEGGPDAIYSFLTKQGIPYTRWDERPLKPDFADVLFVQNPYDRTRPAPLQTPQLLRLVPRLAYVPYGLEIGGGETNATNQFNLPLQQHAWAVFARSPRHQAMFERFCSVGAAHVAVTGHPRLDTLRELEALPPDEEFTAFARGRKIVFWNPQFDIRPDGTGYSTFLLWQEYLLEEFARRQDLAFVIRPHPLFFGTLEARRIWSRVQVQDFLQRVERAGNVLIDRRSSYLPVFAASSAMLSDASTFLLEYSATGKPLLYLHNPRGPALNADGEFIRAHNYSAESKAEIASFLNLVAAGDDPRAAARLAAYPEVMHCPAEGVAAAIKGHILARLAAECATPALLAT